MIRWFARLLATGRDGRMTWRQRRDLRRYEDQILQEWLDNGGWEVLNEGIRAWDESMLAVGAALERQVEDLTRMGRILEVGPLGELAYFHEMAAALDH